MVLFSPSIILYAGLVTSLPSSIPTNSHIHSSRTGRTLPLPTSDHSFHFVIFGDRTGGPRSGLKILSQAVKDTNLLSPDLVMTVGDLIEGYNQTKPWLKEMREYRTIMGNLDAPWYPVAGNHDIYWRGAHKPPGEHESNYETHFGPLWYWFSHKNSAFIVLYSDEGDPKTGNKGLYEPHLTQMSSTQLNWLASVLQQTKRHQHVFVFIHHPRWISDRYPGSNWNEVHSLLRSAGNVAAVFAGHIHKQRYDGKKDGIEYITLGTTGGGMPISSTPSTGWAHHLNLVTVRNSQFTVASIPVGQVINPKRFTPEYLARIDRLLLQDIKISAEDLKVRADGQGQGLLEITLNNPLDLPVHVTAELNSDDPAWSFRPDHIHQEVPPKRSIQLQLGYHRIAAPLTALSSVEFEMVLEVSDQGYTITGPTITRVIDPTPIHPQHIATSAQKPAVLTCLNASTGGLRIGAKQLALPDGPWTLEAWVLPHQKLSGVQGIASKLEWSEYGLLVENSYPIAAAFIGDKYITVRSNQPLKPNHFSHIAAEFDGQYLRIYQDGKMMNQKPAQGARRQSSAPLIIGGDPSREGYITQNFNGIITGVKLSKVARYAKRLIAETRTSTLSHSHLVSLTQTPTSALDLRINQLSTHAFGTDRHTLFNFDFRRASSPLVIDQTGTISGFLTAPPAVSSGEICTPQ